MFGEAVLGERSQDHADDLVVERDLVDRARTDPAAFAQLYRCHVDAVYRFAYRRCGSQEVAEEATSATFERALRSIGGFEWRGHGLRPWLLRIASNEVAEVYRRRSRVDRMQDRLAAEWTPTAGGPDEESLDSGVDLRALHAALDRLPERYRAVISLRYLAGLSAGAAATELGCTKPVLAVTLHRALRALRTQIDRGGTGAVER